MSQDGWKMKLLKHSSRTTIEGGNCDDGVPKYVINSLILWRQKDYVSPIVAQITNLRRKNIAS